MISTEGTISLRSDNELLEFTDKVYMFRQFVTRNLLWFVPLIIFLGAGCNSGDPYTSPIPQGLSIVKVVPQENAVNVDTLTKVEVTFENELNAATLLPQNLLLSDTRNGSAVTAKIEWQSQARKILITPLTPLNPGRDYELALNQIKGAKGEFVPPHVFRFRTALPFEVVKINPAPEASGVPVVGALRQEILIQFSESLVNDVDPGRFYAYEESVGEQFSTTLDAQITYNETLKALSLKPRLGRLKYSTRYHVVLRDIRSVNQGRLDEVRYSFTTEMAKVRSIAPASNSLSNTVTSAISILFSLPVDRDTVSGNIKLRKYYGFQEEYIWPESPQYFEEGEGTRVTYSTASSPLLSGTRYEIFIDGVKSSQGERFDQYKSWFETAN